jgi:hypothetical protein
MEDGAQVPLTHERLLEVLDYDPVTGVFTWRVSRPKCRAGDAAGSLEPRGYRVIKVDGKRYYAHRLAWFYVYGRWPTDEVDHRFGVKDDNRIGELREATPKLNQQNRSRANRGSVCASLGVRRMGRRYQARIKLNGKHIHLGTYDTEAEAATQYLTAKAKYHPFATISGSQA